MQGWGWFTEVIQLSNSHAGGGNAASFNELTSGGRVFCWFIEVIQLSNSHAGEGNADSFNALTSGCRVGVGL